MKRKGSLLLRNLAITFLASVVVLFFIAIIVNGNIQSSIQYTASSRLDSFKSAVSEFDTLLDRFDFMLENNYALSQCFTISENRIVNVAYESALKAILESMKTKIDNRLGIYVYIRGDKSIYSQEGREDYSTFQQYLSKEYDPDQSQLFKTIMSCRSSTLLRLKTQVGTARDQLVYLVPFSITPERENSIVVLYMMPSEYLHDLFSSYLGETYGIVSIYPTKVMGLFYASGESPVSQNIILKHTGTGVLSFSENGANYQMLRILNSVRSLSFCLLDTQQHFFEGIRSVRNSQNILFAAIVGLLMVLSLFISFTNALPIRKYVAQLSGGRKLSTNENELAFLKMYHEQLTTENEILSLKLGQIHLYAASHLVQQLIFGKIKSRDAFDYLLSCSDIHFPHAHYCVFYMLPGEKAGATVSDVSAIILQEPKGIRMLPGELPNEQALAIVVNFTDEAGQKHEIMKSLAERWLGTIRQRGYHRAVIGVGSVIDDPLALSESFSHAAAAVRLRRPGSEAICFMTQPTSDGWEETQICSLIMESVRRTQTEQAYAYWKESIVSLSASATSVLMFQFKTNSLVQSLITQMKVEGIVIPDEIIEKMIQSPTTDDLIVKGCEMIRFACMKESELEEERQFSNRRRVMEYIHSHFTDYEMSIHIVSQQIQMRPSQINEILRQDVGMLFVQYIAYLRMEEFKRRLISGSDTVQTLVHAVGYNDVPSFLRKFKLQEGMTPSEYRQNRKTNAR